MNLIAIDRSGIDHDLLVTGDFAKQLAISLTDVATKHSIPVLRRLHNVILALPHRMAATLVLFHPFKPVHIRREKARDLPAPYRELPKMA
jgi:hypothetical protein